MKPEDVKVMEAKLQRAQAIQHKKKSLENLQHYLFVKSQNRVDQCVLSFQKNSISLYDSESRKLAALNDIPLVQAIYGAIKEALIKEIDAMDQEFEKL